MARIPRIPGAASEPVAQAAETQPEQQRTERMGIPDFRQKSCAAAAAWFAEHPEAPRRNVLTAEGWYVHPEQPTDRASMAMR